LLNNNLSKIQRSSGWQFFHARTSGSSVMMISSPSLAIRSSSKPSAARFRAVSWRKIARKKRKKTRRRRSHIAYDKKIVLVSRARHRRTLPRFDNCRNVEMSHFHADFAGRSIARGRYRRQREYPQPPPPSKNNTTITINKVSIVSPLFGLPVLNSHITLTRRDCSPILDGLEKNYRAGGRLRYKSERGKWVSFFSLMMRKRSLSSRLFLWVR
jgi:hypothetical protein